MAKKVLSFVLILVIIAAIILAAYKLFFAKKNEPADDNNKPVPTESSQPSQPDADATTSPSPSVSPDTSEPEKPLTSDRAQSAKLSFTAEGVTDDFDAELFLSDFGTPEHGVAYSIYIDKESFEYTRNENTDVFETESGAKMEISLHPKTTGEALSPSFMDGYIDFTDIEFEGNSAIGATGLRGFIIEASGADISSRAYLINYEGDVIAVVMTYTGEMLEGYVPRMTAMLDSLRIEI